MQKDKKRPYVEQKSFALLAWLVEAPIAAATTKSLNKYVGTRNGFLENQELLGKPLLGKSHQY